MADINDVRQERARILAEQKSILSGCEKEARDLNPAEAKRYSWLDGEFERLSGKIVDMEAARSANLERGRTVAAREADLARLQNPVILFDPQDTAPGQPPDRRNTRNNAPRGGRNTRTMSTTAYRYNPAGQTVRDSFNRFLVNGLAALSPQEFRALQADNDSAGGFLTTPVDVVAELIQDLDDAVFARRFARVIQLETAQSLGAPVLENDLGDPTWTTELGTGAEDSVMNFARRDLYPHPVARRIKVSNKLLRLGVLSPETVVRERMAAKIGSVQENAFLNGSGVNQPLGIFTPHADGITTARDVSTGNTATAITADNLIECVGAMKSQYRAGARWIFSRAAETQIRRLKDGDGHYIWTAGLNGNPSDLLGFPVDVSEFVPSTFTTGKYVGALVNWKYFWIVDALDLTIKRLDELYAESNQTGYIVRMETDAAPVNEQAFCRVKLA